MRVLGRFTGPAYPLGSTPDTVLGPQDDVSVVAASMANILTTPKGSVFHNPDIGSVVADLLFEINDEVTRALIRHYVTKDITEQDPRVNILSVYTEVPDDGLTIIVTISFALVGDPSGQVYSAPIVFPIQES